MNGLKLFLAEGVLGYLLQCTAYVIGICALAKKHARWLPLILSCLAFTVATYFIRTIGQFNFGVHTMLTMLIANVLCMYVLKVDVRASILGSLIDTALVLIGEVIDYLLLILIYGADNVAVKMADPLFKAWAAVPGNAMMFIFVLVLYIFRVLCARAKGSGNDAKAGSANS